MSFQTKKVRERRQLHVSFPEIGEYTFPIIFVNEKVSWTISDRKNSSDVQFRFFLDSMHKNRYFQKFRKLNLEN